MIDTQRGRHVVPRSFRFCTSCIAYVALLCLPATASPSARAASATEVAKTPAVIFEQELTDVPGKTLIAVALEFPPTQQAASRPLKCLAHRHPGSTYVYVTKGAVRLGIDGEPVRVVHAGESFFEPPRALHTVAESASDTEPASAIAVLILPHGAPVLIPQGKCVSP
jgi:quercetin dioxygenase-like cupin family protein